MIFGKHTGNGAKFGDRRSASQPFPTASQTSSALDNLRGFVIIIVVAFHSFLAYLGSNPSAPPLAFDSPPYHWKAIPISDSARWFGFDLFCAAQYVYLIQFMFFLSGLFVWPSLRRKGAVTYLAHRALRLGVPFLLGTYLLMPLAHYPVYRVTADDPSLSAFWAQWVSLPFWPSGPMWFLGVLLGLDIVAAGLFCLAPGVVDCFGRNLWRAARWHPGQYFTALLALSAATYAPLAVVFKPWDWVQFGPFAFQASFALLYLVYFLSGLGMGAFGIERGLLGSKGGLARSWAIWAVSAFGGFITWIIPTAVIIRNPAEDIPSLELLANLGFVLASVSACFALTAVFLRFVGACSPLLHSLSRNAYGIYLVHYLFVIWVQYLLLATALPGFAKGMLVFTATLSISWALVAGMRNLPIAVWPIRHERPSYRHSTIMARSGIIVADLYPDRK